MGNDSIPFVHSIKPIRFFEKTLSPLFYSPALLLPGTGPRSHRQGHRPGQRQDAPIHGRGGTDPGWQDYSDVQNLF